MTAFRLRPVQTALLFMMIPLLLLGATSAPRTEADIPEISRHINAFTIDLLKHEAQAADAPKNTVLSPQSIFHGLAMSYIASGGRTREELAEVLHFPGDNQQLIEDLSDLRRQLHATARHSGVDVTVANSAWLDGTYAAFREDYVNDVQRAFEASLHTVKFKQRDRVSEEINKWVLDATHGKIQRSVGPEDFNSKSRIDRSSGADIIDEPALVMVNAVYFKADWGSRFDKGATRQRPFHVDAATTKDALMMHQQSLLLYSEDERVKFLEIPYIEGSYSMYIMLPKALLSVRELMDLVSTDMIVALRRHALAHEVDVLLPRFEIRGHLGAKAALSAMGVRDAFDSRRADFDKMIIKKREAFRVYINEIYHDARIDVHEQGAEAAAATTGVHYSFGCGAPAALPRVDFHADRPFVFLVVHNQSRSILFAGWISDPKDIGQQARPAAEVLPEADEAEGRRVTFSASADAIVAQPGGAVYGARCDAPGDCCCRSRQSAEGSGHGQASSAWRS